MDSAAPGSNLLQHNFDVQVSASDRNRGGYLRAERNNQQIEVSQISEFNGTTLLSRCCRIIVFAKVDEYLYWS